MSVPWVVIGGWALDLWRGEETRAHEDLEIAVLRSDFGALRSHLSRFAWFSVGDGEVRRMAPDAAPPADRHQNWLLDESASAWRMDVMLEPGDAGTWVFRRDARIRAPRSDVVGTRDGIAYLRPEAVLLYKAKARRPKDEGDFLASLPRLESSARAWLSAALAVAHPGHPWSEALGRA